MKKLFVLGLPGSGKSTVARFIVESMGQYGFWSERVNDYNLLKRKFDEEIHASEKAPRRFYRLDQGGFYIIDRTICDEVLHELDLAVESHFAQLSLSRSELEGIMVIEFARSSYLHAFNQFQNGLPGDAYLLFLDASLPICRKRVQERAVYPKTEDDYFVSDYTFEFYCGKDNKKYLQTECDDLARRFGLSLQRMKIISTEGAWEEVEERVQTWLETTLYKDLHRKLPDTGPLQQPLDEMHLYEAEVNQTVEV